MDWLIAHAAVLQLGTSAVTALVWIVYLQAFLGGYRRQQRSMILITSGAGRGLNSHCMVTNLGFEPISILSILIEASDGEREEKAVIPERTELIADDGNDDASATNQGPMASGTMRDLGRLKTLLDRGLTENDAFAGMARIVSIRITIVAANASSLTGAARTFGFEAEDSGTLRAQTLETAQLRSRKDRKFLCEILHADPRQEV